MLTGSSIKLSRSRLLLALAALLLTAMACQAVTGAFQRPTSTPSITSSATPALGAAGQPTPTAGTAGPTPQFNAAGVRSCYYVPGVSVPAQMPPEVLATPTDRKST